ncbi:MAG TPA: aminoacyl-tRNA hydrolase [Candidatus Saccharimonadales bacterium]|nr:aminoacyl-tRNA hydrolase [Candidatus Saccharimonadales bacterium]
MNKQTNSVSIKAIVGLGNPGPTYAYSPHNIGFLIVDKLCEIYHGTWSEKNNMLIASVEINDKEILLIKPQTFMNNSGEILPYLSKRGIKLENMFVIHDEIDFPFGKVSLKHDGSARGHNGLRSLIAHGGQNFLRLRCGVGRPNSPADVGHFVTSKFKETPDQVNELIDTSVTMILAHI